MTMGSSSGFAGIITSSAYNNRLQPILLSAASPSGTVFSECFDFHLGVAVNTAQCSFSASTVGDNGNVNQIVNNRDSTRTQNFTYDSLNRIASGYSSGTQWGETYTIDTWGNLTNRGPVTGKTNYEPLSVSAGTNNQLSGFGYDAAGNMTQNGSAAYTFDAENRLIATAGYSYLYDGDGQRVEKCTEGTTPGTCASGATGTLYWRGNASDALSETDLAGNLQNTYVFFNGQRVARQDSAGAIHYYFSDHLGSHGVVENSTGSACEQDIDYYPYGGQEHDYCPNAAQNYKFTGKERDTESGLDNFGARYDASSMGRFMTPDPLMASGHARNPQTWNRYAYVLNNPLRFVDPDGMEVPDSCAKDKDCAIVVKVNVIYDKTVNKGKGLTDQQKQAFEKDQIGKATSAYGTSNIKLDVSYTAGSYTVGADGKTYVTGLQSNALNVVASNATPSGAAGDGEVIPKTNTAVTFINVGDAHSSNAYPLWTNTAEHELAHQFLGDVYQQPNPFSYEANEFVVDSKVAAQAAGVSQQSFRVGLEPRSYAAPQNPEANKPQQ